jgi:hypothetical protein
MLNRILKNIGFEGLGWVEYATLDKTFILLSHDSLKTTKYGEVVINYKL